LFVRIPSIGVGRRVEPLHQRVRHARNLVAFIDEDGDGLNWQRRIKPLTQFQAGDDFFQRSVRVTQES
jgi:hypothetical protein